MNTWSSDVYPSSGESAPALNTQHSIFTQDAEISEGKPFDLHRLSGDVLNDCCITHLASPMFYSPSLKCSWMLGDPVSDWVPKIAGLKVPVIKWSLLSLRQDSISQSFCSIERIFSTNQTLNLFSKIYKKKWKKERNQENRNPSKYLLFLPNHFQKICYGLGDRMRNIWRVGMLLNACVCDGADWTEFIQDQHVQSCDSVSCLLPLFN